MGVKKTTAQIDQLIEGVLYVVRLQEVKRKVTANFFAYNKY